MIKKMKKLKIRCEWRNERRRNGLEGRRVVG